MANMRVYLVHQPSGNHLCIGKRMGSGYYKPADKHAFEKFFDAVEAWEMDNGWNMDSITLEYHDWLPPAEVLLMTAKHPQNQEPSD